MSTRAFAVRIGQSKTKALQAGLQDFCFFLPIPAGWDHLTRLLPLSRPLGCILAVFLSHPQGAVMRQSFSTCPKVSIRMRANLRLLYRTPHTRPGAWLWFLPYSFAVNDFARKESRASRLRVLNKSTATLGTSGRYQVCVAVRNLICIKILYWETQFIISPNQIAVFQPELREFILIQVGPNFRM